MPRAVSRDMVQVVLRDSRSTSPDCSAVKRSLALRGVYLTLFGSLKIAAATARQTSTSKPVQLPFSSGLEKPGRPWLTPHCTKPLFVTALSVGPGSAFCARAGADVRARAARAAGRLRRV